MISRSDRGTLARWWFTIDRPLISAVLLLMSMGVLISMAASPPVAERIGLDTFHFFKSQLFYLTFAVIGLIALSFFDVNWVRRTALIGFVGALALMVAALFFGPEIKGAHRWINVGPISLQPSEFAKPCYVAAMAWFLAERTRRPDMPGHFIAYGMAAVFLGLLVLQPDFGQAALVVTTTGAMLLLFGIPWLVIAGLIGCGVLAVLASYALVPHVASRIDRFLSPEKGDTFQTDTAMEAFRNGGLMGTGPGGGQAKLVLPDAHTDFTFAVVGEEFGLIACLAIMALFIFIVMRVLKRAKMEEEPFTALAMAGLVTMFGLQAAINMGVNVALLPAKGMTLPFISYGGSSLLGTAMAMGFVLALSRGTPLARPARSDVSEAVA
ncbi:MAG: putative lipid II flippase FtsW [Phyllobacteriaceae bacterium]|nr:putative lipid II flippase FtsW [Phyllobacteriaceae bacterium]